MLFPDSSTMLSIPRCLEVADYHTLLKL